MQIRPPMAKILPAFLVIDSMPIVKFISFTMRAIKASFYLGNGFFVFHSLSIFINKC